METASANQYLLSPQAMSAPQAAPLPPSGRRRGGRGHKRRNPNHETQQNQPANGTHNPAQTSEVPQVPESSRSGTVQPPQHQDDQSHPQRENGGGRKPRTRQKRSKATRLAGNPQGEDQVGEDPDVPHSRRMGARGFEARLTRPGQEHGGLAESAGTKSALNLRAEAAAFVPGMSVSQGKPPQSTSGSSAKGKGKVPKQPPQPPRVTTKSTAHDITTRIHEDMAHGLYECPICTSEMGRRSRVWSCELCWTVFHLSCIKKWSTNEGAAAQNNTRQPQDGNDPANVRAWRCPGCNLSHEIFPSTYSCWCEKEVDPRSYPGLPPHSCGQTCSRPRKGCPHPCDATCHAGPCAPCTAMGPTQDCFCGRNSSTKRCQDTDYQHGWSCGEICGDLLPCGEHTCSSPCHEGLCGACDVKIDARCYCGKLQTEMLCSSKDEELDSAVTHDNGSEENWTGCFSCNTICNRSFDCGNHACQQSCHPQDSAPPHCPISPDVVDRCPCGKTLLTSIPGFVPRATCEDPIPNCSEPCGRILPCGHSCDQLCHTGPCGACLRRVPISCRCGRNTSLSVCHQGNIQPPQCFRVCKAGLHCGRHTCSERCCPGEQSAIERQAARRKLKPHLRPADEEIEAEHICTRICDRMLKCGRHTCPELCHKGACNTCREAIFEEISCHCGRSVLHPPLPCGTKPPPCSAPCGRPKSCGHPQTAHNCHTDEESCPKCPFLTEKVCLCGKRAMKNVPCWLTDARCGQSCGQPLKCGSHFCKKDCHRPGDCEDATKPCQQVCGKTKTLCGHACAEPCHAPYPCPEKTPCPSMLAVTCGCGRLRQERRCNAAKAVTSKGQLQQAERLPSFTPLPCNDECSRLDRNRSLASALGIDINQATTVQAFSSSNLPYSSETLDGYLKLASTVSLSTLQTYESNLHSLAVDTSNRSIRFQPAKPQLRAFSHSLATDWGFVTESHDPEPHRHVFVLKPLAWTPPVFGVGTGTSIGIGGMSVRECVKLRERERTKEGEARRVAAMEAKSARDAAKAQTGSAGDGWAQVASRGKKPGAEDSPVGTRSATPVRSPFSSRTIFSALVGDGSEGADAGPKKERLVLRSGVSAGKPLRQPPAADVVESWEEAEEKEEQQEQVQEKVEEDAQQASATEPEMLGRDEPNKADGTAASDVVG